MKEKEAIKEKMKQIQMFLNPTRNDFYDPFLLPDMEIAVNRIIKAIAQWIPAHVSGKVIIGIYRILDTFNIIRKSVREEHKRHNIEQLMSNDSPLKNKYIDNQPQTDGKPSVPRLILII